MENEKKPEDKYLYIEGYPKKIVIILDDGAKVELEFGTPPPPPRPPGGQ